MKVTQFTQPQRSQTRHCTLRLARNQTYNRSSSWIVLWPAYLSDYAEEYTNNLRFPTCKEVSQFSARQSSMFHEQYTCWTVYSTNFLIKQKFPALKNILSFKEEEKQKKKTFFQRFRKK